MYMFRLESKFARVNIPFCITDFQVRYLTITSWPYPHTPGADKLTVWLCRSGADPLAVTSWPCPPRSDALCVCLNERKCVESVVFFLRLKDEEAKMTLESPLERGNAQLI